MTDSKNTQSTDPLLTEEVSRNSLFPIRYPKLWEAYLTQVASFWLPHEVDLKEDNKDWDTLSKDEQYFLKMILAFFANSDIIVNRNIDERFSQDLKVMEGKITYDFQKTMENIHSHMYSLLIDQYIKDPVEKERLFNAIETIPIMKKKAQWVNKWIASDLPYCQRIVAISAVEGLFFSSSFSSIFWLKHRHLMPGLCLSNDFISRDERMHTDFAVLVHSELQEKCPKDIFESIMREAVDIETEFITQSLPCNLLGINAKDMETHIKFVANRLCVQYGYDKPWPEVQKTPFTYMELINLPSKANFFEKRSSQYNKLSKVELEETDPYADL